MFKKFKLGTKIISLLMVLVISSVSAIGILSTNSQVAVINDNLMYTTKELSKGFSQQIVEKVIYFAYNNIRHLDIYLNV